MENILRKETIIYRSLIDISIINITSIPIVIPIIGILGCKFIYYIMFVCLLNLCIICLNKKTFLTFLLLIGFILIQMIFFKELNIAFLLDYILLLTTMIIYINPKNLLRLEQYLLNNRKKILRLVVISILIEFIFFIFKIGLELNWGSYYFKAFMDIHHNNSYFLLVLQIMVLYYTFILKDTYSQVFLNIIILVIVILNLTTGARISTGIALILFFISIINFIIVNKKYRYMFIVLTVIITIICILLNNKYKLITLEEIPFVKKFITTIESGNITNSRDQIREVSINYYEDSSLAKKIIGNGFGFTLKINKQYLNSEIWAHNDFIDILVCSGALGLTLYIAIMLRFIIKYKSFLFSVITMLLAYWNGLYTYYILCISLPILMLLSNRLKFFGKGGKNGRYISNNDNI